MKHDIKNAKSVYSKAEEIDLISKALAVNESFDIELLTSYKHWSLQFRILESINQDMALLRKCLRKLTKSKTYEELQQSIRQVDCISFNLISYSNGLEHNPSNNKEYISLLKRETYAFTKLYKKWASTFIL